MGRKKRKSIATRKPALHFVESPINIQNNIPSPVACALNPPTAKLRSVDEFGDLSWVSPQFRNQHCADEHKKRGRGKTQKVRHNSRKDTTNNSLSHSVHISKKCKYKPLPFLGSELPGISPAEEVDITCDEDEDIIRRKTVVRKSRASQLKNKLKTLSNQSVTLDGSIHSFLSSKDLSRKSRKSGSDTSSEHGDKDHNFTRIRPRPSRGGARARRLLENSCEEGSVHGDIPFTSYLQPCDINDMNGSIDSYHGSTPGRRKSARLHQKYLESLQYIRTTTPPRQLRPDNILAFDTPESEYGMTIKEKQLREYANR